MLSCRPKAVCKLCALGGMALATEKWRQQHGLHARARVVWQHHASGAPGMTPVMRMRRGSKMVSPPLSRRKTQVSGLPAEACSLSLTAAPCAAAVGSCVVVCSHAATGTGGDEPSTRSPPMPAAAVCTRAAVCTHKVLLALYRRRRPPCSAMSSACAAALEHLSRLPNRLERFSSSVRTHECACVGHVSRRRRRPAGPCRAPASCHGPW